MTTPRSRSGRLGLRSDRSPRKPTKVLAMVAVGLLAFGSIAVGCSGVSTDPSLVPNGPPSPIERTIAGGSTPDGSTGPVPSPPDDAHGSAPSEIPVTPVGTRARPIQIARASFRLPAARSRAVAVAFGTSTMVCGGLTRAGTTTDVIWRLDSVTGQIISVGHLKAAVHDAGGAAIGATGLVLGGGQSGPGSGVQSVDASGTSASTGRLPLARADLVAVAIGGRVLVIGGGTPARYDRSVLATRDGRHFRTIASLRVGVRYPAVAALDGRVYVVGGSTPSGDSRDIQVIDPRSRSVTVAGRLPFGLSHAAALVVGGQLLVAGGRRAARAQSGVWRLDVGAGGGVTAVSIGRLPYPVSDAAVVVMGGVGYLLGGEGARIGVPLDDVISLTRR